MKIPCDNLDSCEPGVEHEFPDSGTTVVFTETSCIAVASDGSDIPVPAGTLGVVTTDCIPEAHTVGVRLPSGVVVWADVEDDVKPS